MLSSHYLRAKCLARVLCPAAVIATVATALVTGTAWGARSAGMYSQIVEAEIKGFVYYTDGKTPAAKVPVRIWDVDERDFIFETETAKA